MEIGRNICKKKCFENEILLKRFLDTKEMI